MVILAAGIAIGCAAVWGFPEVPSTGGLFASEAARTAENAGFELVVSTDTTGMPALLTIGRVLGQKPRPGTRALRGSSIQVDVAVPERRSVVVPEVRGMVQEDAIRALAYAWLVTSEPPGPGLPGRFQVLYQAGPAVEDQIRHFERLGESRFVTSQSPPAGTRTRIGTTVTLDAEAAHSPAGIGREVAVVSHLVAQHYGSGGPLGMCGLCHQLSSVERQVP